MRRFSDALHMMLITYFFTVLSFMTNCVFLSRDPDKGKR